MKKVFAYFKSQAICNSAEEAVNFINSLRGITCNAHAEKSIQNLFSGHKDRYGRELSEIATSGCGNARIKIYDALADTIEEHVSIYEINRQKEKQERIRVANKAAHSRMVELKEERAGWYLVSFAGIQVDGFKIRGNDNPRFIDFHITIQANSGIDAYNKVSIHLEKTMPSDMTTGNFTYAGHWLPSATSMDYYFKFLGAATDESYSVDSPPQGWGE